MAQADGGGGLPGSQENGESSGRSRGWLKQSGRALLLELFNHVYKRLTNDERRHAPAVGIRKSVLTSQFANVKCLARKTHQLSIARVGHDDGQVMNANASAGSLFERAVEEMIGLNLALVLTSCQGLNGSLEPVPSERQSKGQLSIFLKEWKGQVGGLRGGGGCSARKAHGGDWDLT